MKLTTEMKEQVRSALIAYCENYPTRNRAAESLQNVSSATVSQLCNGKYDLISDDMFTRIAVQIGFAFDSWTLHEGKTFKEITFALSDAQAYKNVTWIVGDAGRRTHRHEQPSRYIRKCHQHDFFPRQSAASVR